MPKVVSLLQQPLFRRAQRIVEGRQQAFKLGIPPKRLGAFLFFATVSHAVSELTIQPSDSNDKNIESDHDQPRSNRKFRLSGDLRGRLQIVFAQPLGNAICTCFHQCIDHRQIRDEVVCSLPISGSSARQECEVHIYDPELFGS